MVKTKSTLRWTHLLVLLFLGLGSQAQTTWFVNPNTTAPVPNGLSWVTGFERLDFALSAAVAGDEIWVKSGTHIPMNTQGRFSAYEVPAGVAVYGGFVGTETLLNQRDPAANLTTLSGDIGAINNYSDNCYHVVSINSGTAATILDGFTIEAGFADGTAAFSNMGGGLLAIFGDPIVRNCTFQNNKATYGGGAMFLTTGGQNPLIEESTFMANIAQGGAGLGFLSLSNGINEPTVRSCNLFDNYATEQGGAMIFIGSGNGVSCNARVQNCLVYANNSGDVGGAIYAWGVTTGAASPEFLNCTFTNNRATNIAGVIATEDNGSLQSKPIFRNSILWGNNASQFRVATTNNKFAGLILEDCILQGGSCTAECDGPTQCNNLVFAGPQFVNPFSDFHIQPTSPAVDAGVNGYLPVGLTEDLDGNARVVGPNVDFGCYEYFTPCHPTPIAYVNHAATGNNDGSNWANAFNDLQDALALAVTCSQITEIWVAEGTYHPGNSRTDRYHLVDQVDIFGGFPNPITWPGNNPGMADRITDQYPSILSGDIGVPGDNSDNIYHIVISWDIGQGTEFDGLYVMYGNADNSEPTLPNITRGYGGGIQGTSNNGQVTGLTINDCRFIENHADIFGGAISHFTHTTGEDHMTLTHSLFEGNNAEIPNGGGGWGGAVGLLYHGESNPTFEHCEFHSNTSWVSGAAVKIYTIINNPHVARFTSCTFAGNDITSNLHRGVLNFQSLAGTDKLIVNKCSFRDNTTSAIETLGPNSSMEMECNNSSFFNNSEFRTATGIGTVPDAGGAMRLIYTKATVNHCSFVSNSAYQGGAIFMDSWQTNGSELDLHNCIFWDNQATFLNFWNNSDGILNNGAASKVRMDHSIWQGSTCADQALLGGTGRITCGPGVLYGQNPNFINLAGGDLRLNAGSPAINTGDASNSLPDDINDQLRPAGPGVEMGCHESLLYSKQAAVEEAVFSFKCYPNPAQNQVKISLDQGKENGTVEILDLNGQVLLRKTVQGSETEFDLTPLANGMYLIHYQSNVTHATQRLVVSK